MNHCNPDYGGLISFKTALSYSKTKIHIIFLSLITILIYSHDMNKTE
jgi:hypothetical protein